MQKFNQVFLKYDISAYLEAPLKIFFGATMHIYMYYVSGIAYTLLYYSNCPAFYRQHRVYNTIMKFRYMYISLPRTIQKALCITGTGIYFYNKNLEFGA